MPENVGLKIVHIGNMTKFEMSGTHYFCPFLL